METTAVKKRKRQKPLSQRAKENKKLQSVMTVVWPVLFGVVIVILWQTQTLHRMLNTDSFTLPLLNRIGEVFVENLDKIQVNVFATMQVALLGLLLGSLLGYVVAMIASIFPRGGKGGLSIVGAFASIPVVALAPVINNWTKGISNDASYRSMIAKIIVVMLIAAANMSLNAYRGLTELPVYAEDLMVMYGAKKRTIIWKLRMPNSVPYVLIALKVSVPSSIMTTIVAEYFAEYIVGVGRAIRENIVLAQYTTAWAYIAVACLMGIISYVVLMIISNIVLRRYHTV